MQYKNFRKKHFERKKRILFVLSCIITFLTVYSLVLPAVTIDKETVDEDNGIVLNDGSDPSSVEENIYTEDNMSFNDNNQGMQAKDSSAFSATNSETKEFSELLREEQEKEKQMAEKISYPSVSFSDTLNDAIVRVSAPEGAFPEGTIMKVEEVEEDLSETLTDVVDNKPIESYKAIDISFYIGEEKIEPLVPIEVSITSSFIAEEPKDPLLVHIDDKGSTDLIETKQIEEKDVQAINDDEEVKGLVESVDQIDEISKDNTLSFESGSFSVYVLVYTVDFHYEVDGKVFDYSVDGGNAIALSELLDALSVLKDSDNGKDVSDFLNDIESVSFSDESLVKIFPVETNSTYQELIDQYDLGIQYSSSLSKEDIDSINSKQFHEGDYALISLRPFESEESLVITLKDNERIEIKVTDAQLKKTVISSSGKTYEITLTYDKQALIPEGSTLNVKEILEGDEGYQNYYDRSLEMTKDDSLIPAPQEDLKNNSYIRIFDIEILHDGNKIEPASEVMVSIQLMDAPSNLAAHSSIVHFGEEKIEEISIDQNLSSVDTLYFNADSFSVYALTYTVDFFYEIDGKVYDFSMQGADSISLRQLIEDLHICDYKNDVSVDDSPNSDLVYSVNSDEDKSQESISLDSFVADIKSVVFTDPSLLVPIKVQNDCQVGQIKTDHHLFPSYPLGLSQEEVLAFNEKEYKEGDWVLISLKPFDSQEQLTIEMVTGEIFTILITDAQDAQMVGDEVLTISNPAGTTIDLFDYWIISQELVARDGWGDLNQSWGGHDDSEGLNGSGNNKGINSSTSDTEHGHALKFSPAWEGTVFNGTKDDWTSLNTNGRDGLNSYTGNSDPFQGIVTDTLVSGYPKLTEDDTIGSNGESLAYLFDPSIEHNGKASYPNVDQLLYVDKDGYYTYDSRDYKADFNSGDSTFTLTEQTSDDSEIRSFWPFGTQNFWTGMHVNSQFSMPTNGQVLNPRGKYKDMQFEFSGDDDTWLYIDGVLVGDAGGIHNRTEIDINFKNGTVTVTAHKGEGHSGDFEETLYLDELFIAANKYNESDWEDIGDGSGHKRFKAGTYHTFDMFYLERGGGESNLYIHYNLISTADFTAHKSYEGYDDDDVLQRNQFRFELIGLDGKYRSVWSEEARDYVLVKEDDTSRAIMPHASSSGAGTTVSPYYNDNTSTELSDGTTVHSQTYITGNVEDGNVNFGTAEISEMDMHDCDEGNPPVYRYMVQEVVPDDAVNSDNIKWADATKEQRAAGGFVKDSVIYDGTIYYMSARVTSWTETDASGREFTRYGLGKTYYTDDTYTAKKTDTPFIDFRNRYTPDIADFEFNKIDANEESVEGAVFGLFRDSACKIPAKDGNNDSITATSDADGKVKFKNVRTGIFFMKELSVPEPYDLSSTVYRVTISKQGSHMSVNSDQNNNPVTEIINLRSTDITVKKIWLNSQGKPISGELHPATVQLRRYKYRRTGPEPQTQNVILHFHFPDYGWNVPLKEFGPYEITGNSVVIHWNVGGCNFFWDQAYTQKITDSSGDNLLQLPLDRDIDLNIYGEMGWASSNLTTVSVDGAYDDSKALVVDDSFPSLEDTARATVTLTSDDYLHAWSIGGGTDYDFPYGDEIGPYLYYVVELDESGNKVAIGGKADSDMSLVSIVYDPEKTEDKGITHGMVTVTNQLDSQTIDVRINKIDEQNNPLDGAVFMLQYRSDSDSIWVGAKSIEDMSIDALDENSQFTVLSGGIVLRGLIDGQYRLQEISAPTGYVICEQYPVVFTVSGGEIVDTDGTSNEVTYSRETEETEATFAIPNTPGVELPSTGGSGITLFRVIGISLSVFALLLLIRKGRIQSL